MRIACIGYREWALNIYNNLARATNDAYLIFRSREQFSKQVLEDFKPDLVLFYGWSWIVQKELLEKYVCLMLHPSDLPRYRGGSPIQNQIIDGLKISKVSIFIMNQELDAGDLVAQHHISLEGSLDQILKEIESVGFKLTLNLIKFGLKPVPQDHTNATYCKRRSENDSEITLDELKNKSSEYLNNKIRMLADPYPNAYINTVDGKKLLLLNSRIEERE